MQLSIGPVSTNLGKKELLSFYEQVSGLPGIRRVYFGEVSCTKRDVLDLPLVEKINTMLEAAGKEAVFSTYALPTNREEITKNLALTDAVKQVELNSYGALHRFREIYPGRPFIVGPFLNCYNLETARYLKALGAVQAVLDVDLELPNIAHMAAARELPLEVMVYGRLPLGISGRCYTAFSEGRTRNGCGFLCYTVREIPVKSQEGAPLFVINGPSSYTYKSTCLAGRLADLKQMGIEFVRLLPPAENLLAAADIFDRIIRGELSAAAGLEKLAPLTPEGLDAEFCCPGGRE